MLATRNLFAASALLALTGAALADDSPVAWWKFDETSGSSAADSAGSYTGTLAGTASFAGGISGNALDAGNGWVSMGNVLPMTATSFSMQTWIKTTDTSGSSTIIAGKHDAGYFNGYLMRVNADSANYGETSHASFYQSNSQGNTAVGTTSVTDGNWHHLMATYNLGTSTLALYVDGTLQKSISTQTIIANSTAFMVAGYTLSGVQQHGFNGLVDEVQLYNYALAADQVAYLYNNPGKAIPAPGLAGLLLAGAGTIARRRSR